MGCCTVGDYGHRGSVSPCFSLHSCSLSVDMNEEDREKVGKNKPYQNPVESQLMYDEALPGRKKQRSGPAGSGTHCGQASQQGSSGRH